MKLLLVLLVSLTASIGYSYDCSEHEKNVLKETIIVYQNSGFKETCEVEGELTSEQRESIDNLLTKGLEITKDEVYSCDVEDIGVIDVNARAMAELQIVEFNKLSNQNICDVLYSDI